MQKMNLKRKIFTITLTVLLILSLGFIYKVEAVTKFYTKPNKTQGKKDMIWESIKNREDTNHIDYENDDKHDVDENSEKDSSDNENTKEENTEQEIYIVQAGDTLFKISVKFNMNITSLKEINGLTDDTIYVGQPLIVLNDEADSNNKKIINNPDDILALVNKKNKLPSDYIPENLIVPNVPFPFKSYHSKKLMREDAALALKALFKKAEEENMKIYALSGYRSYDRQKSIFTSNVRKKGLEEANKFSARPGESEHQTGLAMDLTSPSVNNVLTQRFGQTTEGKWIKDNSYKFGFIIRYPKGKEHITGYQYEPWHIRYVGKEAAKEITDKNITLEEYLGEI